MNAVLPRLAAALVASGLLFACAAEEAPEAEELSATESGLTACTRKYTSSSMVMEFDSLAKGRDLCADLCAQNLARSTAGRSNCSAMSFTYSGGTGDTGISCKCSRTCSTEAAGCAR